MKIIEEREKYRIVVKLAKVSPLIFFKFEKRYFIQEKVQKKFLLWSWDKWKDIKGIVSLLPYQCLYYEESFDLLSVAQWEIKKLRINDMKAFL